MKKIIFLPAVLSCAAVCLMTPVPVLSIDRVIRLYICQTEHDLDEITSWEYASPEKYRQATKNRKVTPLEAARVSAAYLVGTEKIECNSDNQVVIERSKSEWGQRSVLKVVLSGSELAAYCPRTIQKYGNLCAP